MQLRVTVVAGELAEIAELLASLRNKGAETELCAAPPPSADGTVHLALLDQELLAGDGRSLIERVRESFPAALICLLASFSHRPLQAGALPPGLWDVLYLPALSDEVEDLLSRTAVFVARRALAARPKEILIVDDEETLRIAAAELVRQRGHGADTADDALEAIGKLQQRHYDLVVTDLRMPGIDGLALLGRIREAYPQLPVVISTGYATIDTAIAALRTGAVDFICKPFTADEFIRVIERALRYSELKRDNLELEGQAREEKLRLRERQYMLRILAAASAELSLAVHPGQVADCWLRTAGQVLSFVCGAFYHSKPNPELVLLDLRNGAPAAAELLALLADRAPGLVDGISAGEVRVRHIEAPRGSERFPNRLDLAAQVLPLGPPTDPCGAVVLLQAADAEPSPPRDSFLRSLTEPASQVLEKLRALADESRLRETAMVAGMHQGVILADLEGRIRVINAAARSLLGLAPEEPVSSLAGLSAALGIPLETAVDDLVRSGETLSREFPLEHPEARILTLDLTLIRGDSREPLAVVGLLRDITEMRETERMKTEFVAIVSHELRTPLTTIKNCNSLLLSGSTGPITPPQERFLSMAQVSITRITRLVNDLLDVANIESGRLQMECAPLDVGELLREVANETEHLLLERGLRLLCGDLDASLLVYADRDRLKQVFFNLVHNAVKFSPDGALIEVRAREASADDLPPAVRAQLAAPAGPLVEVQVIDEGVGIAAEDLERIFERFQQVEQTLRREHGGIGLGLPISRGIVRSHGGEIWAQRREPVGSIFRVLLPRVTCASGGGPEDGPGRAAD